MDRPGSLRADEVYTLTAYLLFLNDLVDADMRIDRETLPRIIMPARDRFIRDDRRGGPEIR
jgi:cytochrome c